MRPTTTGLLALCALGIGYFLGVAGPRSAVAQGTNPPPIIVDRITELQAAITQTNRRVALLERTVKTLETDRQAAKARVAAVEASLKTLRAEFAAHKHTLLGLESIGAGDLGGSRTSQLSLLAVSIKKGADWRTVSVPIAATK